MVGDAEVYRTDSAEIRCLYNFSETVSAVEVQWFVKNHQGKRIRIAYSDLTTRIQDKNTEYTKRIHVAGHSGEEILTIENVELSDEREFFCLVDGLAAGIEEGRLHLKDPPEPPVIEAVHSGVSVANILPSKIATCECKGYPQPNITWYRNNSVLCHKYGQVHVITLVSKDSTGLFTVQSELQYKVTKEDKDVHFFCSVVYYVPGAARTVESKRVNISVHYPTTKVEMWRESPRGLVKEGDTVEIRCRGNGSPLPPVTFSREQRPEEKLEADNDLLVLKEVTRDDSGKYLCRALDVDSTDYEDVVGNLQLTVHYLDPAVMVPRDPEVMQEGENLTATCNALSSLDTSAVWSKNGVEIGKGNALHLQDATSETTGHYHCEVTVLSLPALQTGGSVHIIVQGAPQLRDEKKEVNMSEDVGKWVNLICDAGGYPRPTVTWSISGSPVWREVVRKETEDSVQSIITLKVSRDTVATCNATNKIGGETKSYFIRGIPIMSTTLNNTAVDSSELANKVIVVSILFLAVFGSILFFVYKKGKLPCGRSGKHKIDRFGTKEETSDEGIFMEVKGDETETSVPLKDVHDNKKPPADQVTI
ncbi:cell surface glycoprotein MUC18-like [Colossoma macropomum]|uniref:cell surface glycoprotein MUC18-like n=1 Tax=Colossoma macropomum TaxID=42526 RepID=UPI001863E552|nr:cell surface glycoprotein MUC18-like [Colossoma macropomum]